MQFVSILMAAGIALGCCKLADASGQANADQWVEAQSLRELPAGIQALLGVGLGATGGIADRGDSFNTSDVSVDNLPGRRFALGIVSGDKVVVAVERGGRGYSVETIEFRQTGATWEPVRCASSAEPPHRPAEMLQVLAARPSPNSAGCRGFAVKQRPGA